MYGGSQKFGRGGGGGAGRGGGVGANKRNSFPPPPLPPQRLSSTTPSRLSLGGSASRGRNPPPSTASAPEVDETFNLISGGNPLSFAAIIRLAPDLVDEIKRVESQGGAAKIKFDPNPNNPLGNVIDVGGKEFRFTWSHEMGGLCDIYEERQSGEDGNGLLVESGCAWRKLNVQRVLDESTKNHLKMRSEEAERKSKSRKAIVLDQCNPSMKSQMKALAAAEASPWKFKHKKDMHFKKRNYESSQVGGPFKNAHKPGFSSSSSAKGRRSTSPLPSPPNQSVPLTSPSVRGNVTESQAVAEDTTPIQARTKENTANSEKDINVRASGRTQEAAARRNNQGTGAVDMQNLLTTLLKENPKGMSIKALEKAVGDVAPNTARKIEPILKKIATYEPPGKYVLKPRVELESSKCPDSGSSPLDHHQKQYVPKDGHGPAPDLGLTGKFPAENLEEQMPVNNNFELEEPNVVEKIDASQHFTELFGDDEPPANGEGQAASSSDSGSDSDSDSGSSDSGSDSGSQSRSRSPAGSASGSDSENDSSSNSKEASDVDIDIMNDDDKEHKSLQDAEQGLPIPASWSMPDARPVRDGSLAGQDGYASEDIDIEKDDDNEAEIVTAPLDPVTPAEKLKTVSLDRDLSQAYGVVDVPNEQEVVEDEFKHGKPESTRKSKGKSKRSSNVLQSEENAEHVKRLKAGSMAQSVISGYMGSSPSRFSPDITNDNHHENHNLQMPNQVYKDDASTLGVHRGYNYLGPGKSAAELLQSGRRPARAHDIEPVDKFAKNPQSRGLDVKHQETNSHSREGLLKQGYKGWKETQDEEGSSNDKYNGKFKEGSLDRKQMVRTDPHYKKPGEEGKKSHAMENSSRLGSSPKDKPDINCSPADRKKLQRELSDLELGELREPLSEETEVTEKQFERLGPFKQLETKLDTSGSRNADLKDKTPSKPTVDPGNLSSPNLRAGVAKNSDIWPKRTPEPYAEESTQPSQRAVQTQQQQSMVARPEVGSLSHKAAGNNRSRHNEGVANQGIDAEGYGETQKKSHTSMQPEDSRQGLGSRKTKGSKSRKSNSLAAVDDSDKRRDVSLVEDRTVKRKRSESSSDENSSYSKYEKEEPELKGPISSVSQYKEYVQEYCEKYEIYLSLHKILENYRNEFHKLGIDLDSAKGRDMERYYKIVAQLRESYQKSGMRHKRLKRIFLVLHKELTHLKQRIKDFAAEYTRD